MSAGWPDGARAALSLSFDNLGEAAEIEMGAIAAPHGTHATATRVVPSMLAALAERGLNATFFVEGLNANVYPELLGEIDAAGHEVGYHAWRHEHWAGLSAAERADNLARGTSAFERLGLKVEGMRPPGGGLGEDGAGVLRDAGLSYGSPAGEGAGVAPADGAPGPGLVLLPFQWRHVDASCLLPPLGPVREQMTGSAEPIDPDAFLAYLRAELDRLVAEGGFATTVLHPVTIDAWLGEERLAVFLDRVAGAERSEGLWVAPCRDVARHVLANAEGFEGGTALDSTSWA